MTEGRRSTALIEAMRGMDDSDLNKALLLVHILKNSMVGTTFENSGIHNTIREVYELLVSIKAGEELEEEEGG